MIFKKETITCKIFNCIEVFLHRGINTFTEVKALSIFPSPQVSDYLWLSEYSFFYLWRPATIKSSAPRHDFLFLELRNFLGHF